MATPLTEAFKALDILNEDTFDYSKQGIDHLEKFLDADNLEDTVAVIDTDAESEDELKDSYVGKVIFECPVCDSLNYHDKETVEIDEEDNLANIDEECPYCHSVGGFKIVGEVAPYHETEVKVEAEEEEKIEEACGHKVHKRIVKESDKSAATSIEDAQKWVDYDMEKYGKISGRTNALIKKAGFQIVKDEYGDYEVVAGHYEALKETKVTPRTRDDVDAIADDKKEIAKARFAKAKDDADADRDYQLKRNKLKEAVEDSIIRGNPTITWKEEDEERYNSGELSDEADLAAYAAYLVDQAGEKLYAFGGMDDEDNTMLLDITGDGNLRKYSFVRGRLRLEECNLKESAEDTVQVLGEDDYIFHEETGDIAIPRDLTPFKPNAVIEVKFEEDNADKVYKYKMTRLSKDGNYIECEYLDETEDEVGEGLVSDAVKNSPFGKIMSVVNGLTEEVIEEDNVSKAIAIINSAGMIAKTLNDNMDEIKTAAKSVIDLKDKVKNLIGSTKAADSDVAKTLEKDVETQNSSSSILSTISNWINKINQIKNPLTEEASCEACAEMKEAKDLTQTEGTIANLLTKHADELNAAATSAAALKSKMIEIVKNSTLADTPAAKRFYHTLETKKSLGALLSTMGTWMTGNKAYESLENIELTTGTEKIKISTEKKEGEKPEDETIVPVDVDTAEEILDNSDKEAEDEVSFEEDELAELGESYLKNVYNNVKSFETTSVSKDGKSIKVEGLINFNSGSKKQTSFTFSPKETSKTGKVRYIGENLGITSNKKAFTLTGKRDGNKLMLESLTYNYGVKNNNGKSTRVYGRVNKKSK